LFQLPENLEKSVLFTQTEFNRLCKRIKELEQEQKKILKDKGKLRYQEIGEQNAIFEELNKKYEEKHILKFGDLIDLKVLDAL
jgi:predicted nuclease with TOPRIM domain